MNNELMDAWTILYYQIDCFGQWNRSCSRRLYYLWVSLWFQLDQYICIVFYLGTLIVYFTTTKSTACVCLGSLFSCWRDQRSKTMESSDGIIRFEMEIGRFMSQFLTCPIQLLIYKIEIFIFNSKIWRVRTKNWSCKYVRYHS